MARLLYADPGSQLVYRPIGSSLRSAIGSQAIVYADDAATVLADIAEYDPLNPSTPGPVILDSTLTVDSNSLLPWFWGPLAGTDTLWVVADGGPIAQINAYYDPRIDAAATNAALAAETSARVAGDAARLQIANNLSDVASTSSSRTNLGLGGAAVLNVGTSAGTVAAGDDSRITGAIQSSIADAKGDLIVGTANDAVARFAVGTPGYVPWADPAATPGIVWLPSDPDALAAGTTTMDRRYASGTVSVTSQQMRLSFFTAPRAETISTLAVATGSTAAAATPTLCRMGIYSVAGNGDLTLVASTANDTTLFASASTRYSKALSASYNAILGQRYALAVLVVTGVATPTLIGFSLSSAMNVALTTSPRLTAVVAGQADLPNSVLSASLGTSNAAPFGEVLP
jgi:hypothetical protein